MTGYIREEFKRAFISARTILSILLILTCIIVGSEEQIFNSYSDNAFNLFMFSYSEGTNAILTVVFPLLVSMPFASSYIEDVKSGSIKYFYTKTSKGSYIITRLCVNGIVGGFVISFSLLISFLFFILIGGVDSSILNNNTIVFKSVYENHPSMYIILLILNSFLCGFVFSTLGLGLSTIFRNKYLAVLLPFIYYIFSGAILWNFNMYFDAVLTYDLNHYANLTYINVIIYDIILLLVGIGTFVVGVYKNGENDV